MQSSLSAILLSLRLHHVAIAKSFQCKKLGISQLLFLWMEANSKVMLLFLNTETCDIMNRLYFGGDDDGYFS